jgi:hypothetical protein
VTTRREFVDWARRQVGSNDRAGYCIKALDFDPGPGKAWCGIMLMAGLRELGMTEKKWGIDGSGMVGPLGLRLVQRPEPGDIGYQHLPWQHHFLVEDVGESTYTSIDGNQGSPGVQRRNRAFKTTGITFYSIAPLLRSPTTPAPPSWDDETEPGPPKYPTLRLGAKHEAVKVLQRKLNAHGAQLVVDGRMGPLTVLAAQSFQRRAGLDADGEVGPLTWRALEAV